MKKELKTEILIKATPEKVWSIFSDFDNYPKWNPFVKSIQGKVLTGNKIKVRLEPPEAHGMTIKPKVLVYKKNRELRWIGHLLIPGLFDGEHRFTIHNNANGTVKFEQCEQFSGILVPLFKKLLDKNTKNGFIQMNNKLKELAEIKAR